MSTSLLDIQEQLRQELELQRASLPAASTSKIKTAEKKFTLPGGKPTEGPIEAIILDWRYFNAYYSKLYNRNSPAPADCSALGKIEDEMAPLKSSPNMQCESCVSCPKNEWGSDPQGGRGKACKNGVRLAVVPAKPDKDMTPWIIDVTPTGMKSFKNYINVIANAGFLPFQVITTIDFDPAVTYPSLTFKVGKAHEHLETAFALRPLAASVLNG